MPLSNYCSMPQETETPQNHLLSIIIMKQPLIFLLLLSNCATIAAEVRCGIDYDTGEVYNTTCADGGIQFQNYCCSSYGYCGLTQAYCSLSEGCQEEYGRCETTSPPQNYNYNYCGYSWGLAKSCSQSCYHGTDGECPSGQTCYADVNTCPAVSPQEVSMSLRGAEPATPELQDVDVIPVDEQVQVYGNDIGDMGPTGTGSPWWIWIIVGVAVLALIICFIACSCHYKKKNKVAQEEEDQKLDQPLIA